MRSTSPSVPIVRAPQLVVATGGLPGWLVLGKATGSRNRFRRGRKVLAAAHRLARREAERIQ